MTYLLTNFFFYYLGLFASIYAAYMQLISLSQSVISVKTLHSHIPNGYKQLSWKHICTESYIRIYQYLAVIEIRHENLSLRLFEFAKLHS